MENVSSNYTGSVPVFNSERPNSSNSIIDRIRQITENVLAKMDELYDKFGSLVYLIGFAGLTIAGALSPAYFVATCILGVSSISLLGFNWYLSGRHIKYLYNKIINKNKDLQLQLRNIQEEMKIAKLMEQLNQSQSKEELIENSKKVTALLKKFQKNISDAYVYVQYKSYAKQCISHEHHFEACFNRILTCLEQPELFDNDPIPLCLRIVNDMEEAFDFAKETISCNITFFEKELKECS